MHNFQKVASGLDTAPLLAAVQERPHLWKQLTIREDTPGSPHHDTETIWLRGPKTISYETMFMSEEAHDYSGLVAMEKPLVALFGQMLPLIPYTRIGRAMIVNLKPGGVIDPHEDTGRYAKTYSRFHLPLQSEPGNVFQCDDEQVHMQVGELWWFNHRGRHTVRNDSDKPRLHLIFDVETPNFHVRALTSTKGSRLAGLRIVQTSLVERIDEIWGLLKAHWREVARNKNVMVLNPDRERYEELDRQGGLLTLAVLDADNEVVGYSVSFIGPHIHYAALRVCNNDILFLREDLRNSTIGLRLLRETEKAAAEHGAKLMLWHAKQGTSLDKILPRQGYGVQDVIYSKEI